MAEMLCSVWLRPGEHLRTLHFFPQMRLPTTLWIIRTSGTGGGTDHPVLLDPEDGHVVSGERVLDLLDPPRPGLGVHVAAPPAG